MIMIAIVVIVTIIAIIIIITIIDMWNTLPFKTLKMKEKAS